MYELTQEQREVIDKISKAFQIVAEAVKMIWEKLKEAWSIIQAKFNTYIMSMQPKKRYKYLKSIGITNYIPFFQRNGIIHCRNNC